MSGRAARTLSEHQSKKMLAPHDLPLAREILANGPDQALDAARELGWPVALKASDPKLAHKSEAGVVALGIRGPEEFLREMEKMANRLGAEPEGWLVAEMVPGNRELVMGVSQQAGFGPCVMLGLGGVFTEALDDVVFRMAPIDEKEALAMLGEIKARAILGPFRGQAAADLTALARALAGLSRFAAENPQVAEVDINPLIIRPDGSPAAVDALVVMEELNAD